MVRLLRRRLESYFMSNVNPKFKSNNSTEITVQGQFLSVLVAYFEEPCFSILRRA